MTADGIAIGFDGSVYYRGDTPAFSLMQYVAGTFKATAAPDVNGQAPTSGDEAIIVSSADFLPYWNQLYQSTSNTNTIFFGSIIQGSGASAIYHQTGGGGGSSGDPIVMAATSDGKIWWDSDQGFMSENFSVGNASAVCCPYYVALAPASDDTMWALGGDPTNPSAELYIDHYSSDGARVARFALPAGAMAAGQHAGLVLKSDGTLWFTDAGQNVIGKLDPSSGHVVEYHIPTAAAGLTNLVLASDGAMWFPESHAEKIGRITARGNISEYAVPNGVQPGEIAAPPGGASCSPYLLWFTTQSTYLGKISF